MRRLLAVAAAAALASGCRSISFNRRMSDDEVRLESEVRAHYYLDMRRAFAVGNAQTLSQLFDPAIVEPMTHADIEGWADRFFAEHGRASFRIRSLSIEQLGFERAVVTITYRVETADGKGGFGSAERATLIKRSGRWYIAAWERP